MTTYPPPSFASSIPGIPINTFSTLPLHSSTPHSSLQLYPSYNISSTHSPPSWHSSLCISSLGTMVTGDEGKTDQSDNEASDGPHPAVGQRAHVCERTHTHTHTPLWRGNQNMFLRRDRWSESEKEMAINSVYTPQPSRCTMSTIPSTVTPRDPLNHNYHPHSYCHSTPPSGLRL